MRCMIPASSSWQWPFVIVFLHSSLLSFHPGKRWGLSRPGRVQAIWLGEATANSGTAQRERWPQREGREACPRPDCSEAGCLAQCANFHLGISAYTFWLTFLSRYFRKGNGSSHLALASPPAETIFKGASGCTGCWLPSLCQDLGCHWPCSPPAHRASHLATAPGSSFASGLATLPQKANGSLALHGGS